MRAMTVVQPNHLAGACARRFASGAAMSLLAWLAMLPGCSVAVGLSSGEILEELDAIVRVEGSGDARSIRYAPKALVSSWYMHNAMLIPIRAPLAWILGRRTDRVLENPGEHVRELLAELPDETGRNLVTNAAACSRFGWLAELDSNPQSRVLAIDGLSRICQQLRLKPFEGDFALLTTPLAANLAERARAGIRASRPAARGDQPRSAPEPYRAALEQMVSAPLPSWDARLALVEDLGALLTAEQDDKARGWVDAALRRAIEHCARGILLGVIRDRDSRWAEVRLCALEQIHRLGGPRTVPLMLATMAATPQERAMNLPIFDPDPLIQLRLIHYCGQLSGELASTVVQLPFRQSWEVPSPNEFLANTVLNERDYYSKLRTPAIVALSWSLGRKTVDPDPAWVREWNERRR